MSIASNPTQVVDALSQAVASWRFQPGTDEFGAHGWREFGLDKDPACYDEWLTTIHEEDRERVDTLIQSLLTEGGDQEFQFEHRLAPMNDVCTTVLTRGYGHQPHGGATLLETTSINIGPLRELTAQLSVQADRFQAIANTAPALIWVTDRDGRCDWFNRRWLDFTGSTMEAALIRGRFGNTHPDDQESAIRSFQAAIAQRNPIEVTYRLRNATGEYRWILDRAFPRYDRDGGFAGYVGTCIDISRERECVDQLAAREAVMRQLHDLNEREKSFMSYAIHDGLLQDIIGADMLLQSCESLSPEKRAERIQWARRTISSAVSHGRRLISELRPTILDEQGLVCAIEYYAAELENRSKLCVTVTSDLTRKICCSLWECNVFRIVQEALNNVESHSGVSSATVHVDQREDRLCVSIRDGGVGFDVQQVSDSFGMLCMRERASIFDGFVSIESATGEGTTIHVEVPLPECSDRI